MRLIEEVTEVIPGRLVRGQRRASESDWYFQGHFPGEPVVPAIVLVELLAQAGGLAAASATYEEPGAVSFRVAALSGFKFLAAATPGAVLEVTAEVAGRVGKLIRIEGTVTANGVAVARGGLTLVELPRSASDRSGQP